MLTIYVIQSKKGKKFFFLDSGYHKEFLVRYNMLYNCKREYLIDLQRK